MKIAMTIGFAFVIYMFGVFLGMDASAEIWELKLIEEKHGEYYLDNNNERQFRLIPIPTKTETE